jgi:FkbM family methyltransferase
VIFVHLGAGAADLDISSNNICGVTEFIKNKLKENEKHEVFLIEANPINIEKLKESYKNFNNIKIFNIGVTNNNSKKIEFYFAEDDVPHYQTCSMNFENIKIHKPFSKISSFKIDAIHIQKFLEKNNIKKIDYLFIDLEGIDFEILSSINFKKVDIRNISIEYITLGSRKKKLINFLLYRGYSYCGYGYDHSRFDFLFKKKVIIWNMIFSNFLHFIDHRHIKIFNYLIFDKDITDVFSLKKFLYYFVLRLKKKFKKI